MDAFSKDIQQILAEHLRGSVVPPLFGGGKSAPATFAMSNRQRYPDTPKGRQQERLAEICPTITAKEANEWLASLPPIPLA